MNSSCLRGALRPLSGALEVTPDDRPQSWLGLSLVALSLSGIIPIQVCNNSVVIHISAEGSDDPRLVAPDVAPRTANVIGARSGFHCFMTTSRTTHGMTRS